MAVVVKKASRNRLFFIDPFSQFGLDLVPFEIAVENETGEKTQSEQKQRQSSYKRQPRKTPTGKIVEENITHERPAVNAQRSWDAKHDDR
jgi:hypothetical protein